MFIVYNKQILNPIFQYSFSALRHAVSDPICLLKHRCSYLFLAYTKSLKKNNFIILNSKLEDMSWKKKASSLFCVWLKSWLIETYLRYLFQFHLIICETDISEIHVFSCHGYPSFFFLAPPRLAHEPHHPECTNH